MRIKRYKYNYLLIGAAFVCCIFLLIASLYGFGEVFSNSSRSKNSGGFWVFALSAIFIAPIMEEYTFRGSFTNSKTIKIISLFSLPLFVFFLKRYDLIPILIIYLILFFIDFKYKISKSFLFLVNSLLFSIMHYKLIDFDSFITVIPMMIQFSLGLALIWIVVNFGMLKSIIAHCLYNLIPVLITFFYLQFPNNEIRQLKIDDFEVTWQKEPILNNMNSKLNISGGNKLEAIAVEPMKLIKIYNTGFNAESNKIRNSEMFYVYSINVKSDNAKSIINEKIITELLLEAKLITKF